MECKPGSEQIRKRKNQRKVHEIGIEMVNQRHRREQNRNKSKGKISKVVKVIVYYPKYAIYKVR